MRGGPRKGAGRPATGRKATCNLNLKITTELKTKWAKRMKKEQLTGPQLLAKLLQ